MERSLLCARLSRSAAPIHIGTLFVQPLIHRPLPPRLPHFGKRVTSVYVSSTACSRATAASCWWSRSSLSTCTHQWRADGANTGYVETLESHAPLTPQHVPSLPLFTLRAAHAVQWRSGRTAGHVPSSVPTPTLPSSLPLDPPRRQRPNTADVAEGGGGLHLPNCRTQLAADALRPPPHRPPLPCAAAAVA